MLPISDILDSKVPDGIAQKAQFYVLQLDKECSLFKTLLSRYIHCRRPIHFLQYLCTCCKDEAILIK